MGHLIVVYFFLCLAFGLAALGLIYTRFRKTREPFTKQVFPFFLSFTALVMYSLIYVYIRENIAMPSAALVSGLTYASLVVTGFFLCLLLIFSNLLKLRRNGGLEWAIAITASLAYCIVAFFGVIPDAASAVLYRIRQPWYTAAIVVFALIVVLTFVPLKPNITVDPRIAAAARRMTIVSVIFLPLIFLDILLAAVLPFRFFPLLYCAYAALIIRDQLREIPAPGPVVLPGDWFFKEYRISPREREILELVMQGMNNPAIARKLFISLPTVKTHIQRIFKKVGVGNRFELIRFLSARAPEPDSRDKPRV